MHRSHFWKRSKLQAPSSKLQATVIKSYDSICTEAGPRRKGRSRIVVLWIFFLAVTGSARTAVHAKFRALS